MDIAEVRRKFPQYSDMSDDELAVALHRKYYSDIPPAEFAAKIGLNVKPEKQPEQSAMRPAALAGRDIVEGLMSIPNMVGDAANTAINYGSKRVNALAGTNIPMLGLPSEAVPRLLTKAGLPEAETGPEQFTGAVNKAVVGFAPIIKGAQLAGRGVAELPFIKSMLTKPVAETAAVATGAGASDLTKQMGGGTAAQLIAGAVAPMSMTGAVDMTRRAMAVPNELRRPLTAAGSRQIAADVLGRTVQDKDFAIARLAKYNADPSIFPPGYKPTAGAVAKDYGLIGGQQLIARGEASPQFAQQFAANNEIITKDLGKLGATKEMLKFYETKRDTITAPLREQTFAQAKGPVDYVPLAEKIAALAQSPAGGRAESQRALQWISQRLDERLQAGRVSPEDAYALHQDIGDLIAGKIKDSNGSALRLAGGLANEAKKTLATQIEEAAPGFKKYLETYSRLSKPIDRLEVMTKTLGGEKLKKLTNAGVVATPDSSSYVVSQARLKNAIGSLDENTRLAPRQSEILGRNMEAMNAETLASRGGKQPGSDTYQNLAAAGFTNNVLGETLANSGFGRMLQAPLNIAGKPFQARINDLVVQAYRDPKLMEELLRLARTKRGSPTLAGGINQSTLGLLGSVLAQ